MGGTVMDMNQMEIDFKSHRSHENSLAEWFTKIVPTLQARQGVVVNALIRMGGKATPKEVASHLGVPLHTISGRFTELKEKGIIQETGARRDRSSELEISIQNA